MFISRLLLILVLLIASQMVHATPLENADVRGVTQKALDADQPQPGGNSSADDHIETRMQTQAGTRVVINIPLLKLYLYDGDQMIKSYPVAIGRHQSLIGNRVFDTETPVGEFTVSWKDPRPRWYPPLWLKKEKKWPENYSVPPGPENPLGTRWIAISRPGVQGYGIHGTNNPSSIGHTASLGCIRMLNRDVEEVFERVQVGTPVSIIYEPGFVYRDSDGSWHLAIGTDVYAKGIAPLASARSSLEAAGFDSSILDGEAIPVSSGSRDIVLMGSGRLRESIRIYWPDGFGLTDNAYREKGRIFVSLGGFPTAFQRYFRVGSDGQVFLYGKPIENLPGSGTGPYILLEEAARRFGVRIKFLEPVGVARVSF